MRGEKLHHPLHRVHAQRLIRHIVHNGEVIISSHARDERMSERGVSEDEVFHALRFGFTDDAELDHRNRWSYKVHGEKVGGAVSIVSSTTLKVTTVWREDG